MQDKLLTKKKTLNFRGLLEDINDPLVMGILNLTPDSFYDGNQNTSIELSIKVVKKMVSDGVDILDIGGYSSRPGAKDIDPKEELNRIYPILKEIRIQFPDLKISIDTFRSSVAEECLKLGAHVINDISGGKLDDNMWKVVKEYSSPYVIMHMPGNPQTMQKNINYKNLMNEVIYDLSKKLDFLHSKGVPDVIIDPGFGFGKTLNQNYEMLKYLRDFEILEQPILVGVSRKSMIHKFLNTNSKEALNGTTAIHMLALDRGADILRVHDVKEAKQAISIWKKTRDPYA